MNKETKICFPMSYRKVIFDEKRRSDVAEVDKIVVITKSINVNFYSACVDTVEAHFWGEAVTNGKLQFSLSTVCGRCTIQVDIIGGSSKGKLQLAVLLPKREYELIAAVADYSRVSVNEGVKARVIDVESKMEKFLSSVKRS